jgi:hypothetical protein
MKMPSLVSPMMSAREPSLGSMEMLVIRMSGRCAHPSARIVPLDPSPMTGAVSRLDRKRWNTPSTMMGVRLAGTPSSS